MNYKVVTDDTVIASVRNGYKKTKLFTILHEFQRENIPVAEVDISEYCSATSCTASLKASIKRYKFTGIDAMTMGNKTYLVNQEALNETGNTESDK